MLCYKCSGRMYISNIGSCNNCGSFTSSGMFHYCSACAKALNKCAACDGQLDAVKPETPADAKLVYLVGVNVVHYRGEPLPNTGRKGYARRNRKAFRAWREDVKQLMVARGWPTDSVKTITELPNIAILIVECTKEVADAVRGLTGTETFSANDPQY
jgi:hypothetical protein